MTSTLPTFGQQLAQLVVTTGYVRKNQSPDWVRFVAYLPGVNYETLRKAVTGERPVSEELMRRVARALSVEPTVFVEYRLMQARRELDPSQVGWVRASNALSSWDEVRRARLHPGGSNEEPDEGDRREDD